ncbi:MAG: kynureninase, partial [Pseudomonadales bacterium]|nr:kynureninase [Pseudomonadales bacterium]
RGFSHEDAYAISRALAEHGVVTDFRSPDILRLGFSPLFLSYGETWRAGAILARILKEKLYLEQRLSPRNKVT